MDIESTPIAVGAQLPGVDAGPGAVRGEPMPSFGHCRIAWCRASLRGRTSPMHLAVIKGIAETLVWIGIIIGVVAGFALGRLTKR